jgi:mutator protein MutT
MKVVVAAIIERSDRRLLIGQRRRDDSSPLKWEFPGGKIEEGETPEAALARELREELGVTMEKCVELGRTRHKYATAPAELEIRVGSSQRAGQLRLSRGQCPGRSPPRHRQHQTRRDYGTRRERTPKVEKANRSPPCSKSPLRLS